jgi:hypothetical protein
LSTSDAFSFTAEIWLWKGDAAWHFISLPTYIADEIANLVVGQTRGFGSVRVEVTSSDIQWTTSIFPDKKSGTYILPIKKDVRRQLKCSAGDEMKVTLRLMS